MQASDWLSALLLIQAFTSADGRWQASIGHPGPMQVSSILAHASQEYIGDSPYLESLHKPDEIAAKGLACILPIAIAKHPDAMTGHQSPVMSE